MLAIVAGMNGNPDMGICCVKCQLEGQIGLVGLSVTAVQYFHDFREASNGLMSCHPGHCWMARVVAVELAD